MRTIPGINEFAYFVKIEELTATVGLAPGVKERSRHSSGPSERTQFLRPRCPIAGMHVSTLDINFC